MDRLTTDNPRDNISALLNFAYAKDRRVVLRYANDKDEVDLCEYIAEESRWKGCDIGMQAVMDGECGSECDCVFTVLNLTAIQAAELRARLMMIEDILGDTYDLDHLLELMAAEREGRLIVLPCKPGTTVYEAIPKCNPLYRTCPYMGGRGGLRCDNNKCDAYVAEVPFDPIFRDRIGKTLFLTREEAVAALAKDNNVPTKEEE